MKKNLTLLLAFVLMVLTQVTAQNTGDEIFVLDLKIDGNTTTYKNGACGFSAPTDWAGPIDADVCYPIVWGYDITPDSVGCDSIANDYTGKMVMIRRGTCEFGAKMLNVQKANGAAGAVCNNYAAANGDACNAPGMGPGAVGAQVTIPAVLFCRDLTDAVDNALKAGKQPVMCFRRLSVHSPSAELTHAIPVTQADTMGTFTVSCVNRTGVAQDFTAKAEITDPAGNITILTATQFIEPGGDSIIGFPFYVPVPQIGTFKTVYSVDLATSVGDTVYRDFIMTPHTFATDNLQLNGGASNNASFVTGGNVYSAAALYQTGAAGMTVKLASFGINNAAAVAIPDNPAANVVNVVLYDADVAGDGVSDLGTGLTAFNALPFVAFNDFEFSATTPVDSIFEVELTPIDGDKVVLLPYHLYYLRLIYDGNAAASGIQLSFTCSRDANYDIIFNGNSVTPITLDNLYSGWSGATVVARLHDEAFVAPGVAVKPVALSNTKFTVTPNPAVDYANVNLQLANQNKSVVVSLMDFNGRIVSSQTVKNFQNGQVKLNTTSLPSGNYAVAIRTSEEGSAMTNLMICH